jgi:hypothetical protein
MFPFLQDLKTRNVCVYFLFQENQGVNVLVIFLKYGII